MKRYLYYLALMNIFPNLISAVPKILIDERERGSITMILLSPLPGILYIIFLLRYFMKYKGKSLPEIMKTGYPKWLKFFISLVLFIFWSAAGWISLQAFTLMLKRFLSPQMPAVFIVLIFLIFITYGILMETQRVAYSIEVILFLTGPFLAVLFFKSYFSGDMVWDFVRQSFMYITHIPPIKTFGPAVFNYLGVANLFVFNKIFKHGLDVKKRDYFFITILAFFTLFSAFCIPLGLVGFDNAGTVIYPGITSLDSLRFVFGIIERVLYVGMTINLALTFLSIILHWHVANQIIQAEVPLQKLRWKKWTFGPYIPIFLLWSITIYMTFVITEQLLLNISNLFYNLLAYLLIGLLIILYIMKWREKNGGKKNEKNG